MQRISEDILNKLKKIKALSDRAGTLAEAEAAGAALSRLLIKHNIQMVDLDDYAEETRSKPEQQIVTLEKSTWMRALLHGLAVRHMCRSVGIGQGRMSLIGHPHNLIAVKEMYIFLRDEVDRIAKAALKAEQESLGFDLSSYEARERPRAWVNSFRHGAVAGIMERIDQEREALKRESGDAWALVPVLEREVEDLTKQLHPRTRKKSIKISSSAYDAGRVAGRGLSTARHLRGRNEGSHRLPIPGALPRSSG